MDWKKEENSQQFAVLCLNQWHTGFTGLSVQAKQDKSVTSRFPNKVAYHPRFLLPFFPPSTHHTFLSPLSFSPSSAVASSHSWQETGTHFFQKKTLKKSCGSLLCFCLVLDSITGRRHPLTLMNRETGYRSRIGINKRKSSLSLFFFSFFVAHELSPHFPTHTSISVSLTSEKLWK